MDGGAWWAAIHEVAKSRAWLSDFTFTFHFHALEEEMATHSIVLAWRIPGMGEPGGLQSLGSHRVGHNWSDLAAAAALKVWLEVGQHWHHWGVVRIVGSQPQPKPLEWYSSTNNIFKWLVYLFKFEKCCPRTRFPSPCDFPGALLISPLISILSRYTPQMLLF